MASALLLAAAAAAGSASPGPPPDVAIGASVRIRELKIEQQGRASARVFVEPSAGERIEVERNLPKGRTRYRNLELEVNVEARLADPRGAAADATSTPAEPATGDRP
ncbi:MAG TPA: hypothetical protein VEB68_08255 [Croceibacterium sp.]|nr:hypothetical protein [Croceibacterium sp.]